MDNLIGRYLFSEWNHNEGYKHNWLRRVTRQTKTQIICDVQHTLALSDKYKKIYDNGSDYMYEIFQHCAKRFRKVGDKIVGQVTHLSNPDGFETVTLIEDFKTLKCPFTYDKLFGIDVRTFLPEGSHILELMNKNKEFYSKKKYKTDDGEIFQISTSEVSPDDDCWGIIVKHLKELLGDLPVHIVNDYITRVDTTHEKSIYSATAIHYHINHFGDDKPVINFKENRNNRTISFWLFDDVIVFKHEDGIDSW